MNFKTVFQGKKAVIGMVHLLPLPGSPNYGGELEKVYCAAQRDLDRLTAGGASAAIVENFCDLPYDTHVAPITEAAMAIITNRLQKTAKIPLGVNVQFNCFEAEWDIACLTGCRFLRVEAFVENRVGPHGITWAAAPKLMRYKRSMPSETMIFADINVKHSFPLAEQPMSFSIHEAIEAGADAIIITGLQTGSVPTPEDIKEARLCAGNTPILVGSGINEENMEDYLAAADGVIVGSSIKEDGNVLNPVDEKAVRRLVELADNFSHRKE